MIARSTIQVPIELLFVRILYEQSPKPCGYLVLFPNSEDHFSSVPLGGGTTFGGGTMNQLGIEFLW